MYAYFFDSQVSGADLWSLHTIWLTPPPDPPAGSSVTMTIFMEILSLSKNLEYLVFRFYWTRQVGFVFSTPVIKNINLWPLHSDGNHSETKGVFVRSSGKHEALGEVGC